MVADWCGAGEAISGKATPGNWYSKNKDKMILHPTTRKQIVTLIAQIEWNFF